jgi:hypothetical protein
MKSLLCATSVFSLSLWLMMLTKSTTDTQRTQRWHRENERNLPMIDEKKTSEVIETSLIYLLSAAVAVGAFVLVWLVAGLLGFSPS